jgi:putative membrane protein
MKATTIFSTFAACAMFSMFACQSPSSDNTTTDSTGAIRQEPDNTRMDPDNNLNNSVDSNRNAQGTVDDKTHSFMKDAAEAGMAEVEIAKLAKDRATNPRVKNFAEMMIKDHSAANNDLMAIARNKSVTLPSTLGKHQDHLEDLSKKKGADFDKEYMKMMVDGHEDVVSDFEKCSQNGTDPDVKTFAAQKLPTVRMHLDSAKAINKALK